MQCPVDGTQLVMTERQGVEIDYCPKCRGVWLDRGELDKIIDRSAAESAPPPPPQPQRPMPHHGSGGHGAHDWREENRGHRYDPRERYDHRPGYDDKYYRKRKKKSILSEIFDFD